MPDRLTPQILRAIDTLPFRQREVIKLRFGIGSEYRYTLEEVGRIFGVSRERIRQIEAVGLNRIKRRLSLREDADA